ncbi:hypothetical protein ACP4OV_003318 [Aristida adscensionis]
MTGAPDAPSSCRSPRPPPSSPPPSSSSPPPAPRAGAPPTPASPSPPTPGPPSRPSQRPQLPTPPPPAPKSSPFLTRTATPTTPALTLDLLSSSSSSAPCGAAARVADPRDADLVFVPFFASLSYNRHSRAAPPEKVGRDRALQERLVRYLTARPEWERSGGADHVVVAHHPNSLLHARAALSPAVFVLSDFGRYQRRVARLEKDVIAPYKHMAKTFVNGSAGFDDRPTLLYFRGAIYRKEGGSIRQELYYMLKDEKDVYFSFGSVQDHGASKASQGMHSSKFCLNIAGDTPSSNRLFDAIVSHCVPVIISDDIELPYEDVLDYSKFSIFVRSSDAVKKGYLIGLISGVSKEKWTKMWERLKEVDKHFEYQYPSQKDDAVQMIWQTLARRVPEIRLKVHRYRRFSRSDRGK